MKIVTVFLKYGYGIESRGASLEKAALLPAIIENATVVKPFWLEENGYPQDLSALQEKLKSFVSAENPDLVFFALMEHEISIDTIDYISQRWKTVNWFADDQWRFDTFTKLVAPHLSFSITMDKYALAKYKQIGYKNAILSQWAATNVLEYQPKPQYLYDISFVGGKNATRAWYVRELAKRGLQVECFGVGWKNGSVSFSQMNDIFQRSKVNLNLSNSVPSSYKFIGFLFINLSLAVLSFGKFSIKGYLRNLKRALGQFYFFFFSEKHIEQMKARPFEISAAGGFQLCQFCLELEDYFVIGKEIPCFSSIDELERLIVHFLQNSESREGIRFSAWKRAQIQTYPHRISEVLSVIQSKIGA